MAFLPLLAPAVFALAVLAAAVLDVASYTIPNRLTAGLALAFVPAVLVLHPPSSVLIGCLLTGALAFALGVGLFALGWCGGGDAKLIAACALWLGWRGVPGFLLVTSLAGGVLALGVIVARKTTPAAMAAGGPAWIGRLLGPEQDLPYAVAIAAGALAAMPAAPLFAAFHHS